MAVLGYTAWIRSDDIDDLVSKVLAAMIASGKWTDSGDSTGDIVYGAADSQGRTPYVQVSKTAGGDLLLTCAIGSDGSGNLTYPAGWTTIPTSNGRSLVSSNGYEWVFRLHCTDRWVTVVAEARYLEFVFVGFAEVNASMESGGVLSGAEMPMMMSGNGNNTGSAQSPELFEYNSVWHTSFDDAWEHNWAIAHTFYYDDSAIDEREITLSEVLRPAMPFGQLWHKHVWMAGTVAAGLMGTFKGLYIGYGLTGDPDSYPVGNHGGVAFYNDDDTWEVFVPLGISGGGASGPGGWYSNYGGVLLFVPTGFTYNPTTGHTDE